MIVLSFFFLSSFLFLSFFFLSLSFFLPAFLPFLLSSFCFVEMEAERFLGNLKNITKREKAKAKNNFSPLTTPSWNRFFFPCFFKSSQDYLMTALIKDYAPQPFVSWRFFFSSIFITVNKVLLKAGYFAIEEPSAEPSVSMS